MSWLEFLSHYGQFAWASDYPTVITATLRTYYVILLLEIASRPPGVAFWGRHGGLR